MCFMAFLCVSQQREFKNTIKNFLGEAHVKNFWPKKLRGKGQSEKVLSSFPFDFFNRVFGRFSAWAIAGMGSPKTPLKCFLNRSRPTKKSR
jgi:hypothetical protein